jgi:hypothetical protein
MTVFLYGARIPFHLLFGWGAAKACIKAGVIGKKIPHLLGMDHVISAE